MAAEIRATGLSEEQTTALLEQVTERGFGQASTTSSGEGEDLRFDASIAIGGQTDVRSLSTWLDQQGITHVVVQDQAAQEGQA